MASRRTAVSEPAGVPIAPYAPVAAADARIFAGLAGHRALHSTINQCIHEAGRAVEPIEAQWVEELQQEVLAYADETPWKEWGQLLWLWVIITPTICLYFIGYRSKEILANVLGEGFVGWLMSDGYCVYRRFQKRLRCWAHLLRKAEGLKESLSTEARAFGEATHGLLSDLITAIYQAREGPPVDLTPRFPRPLGRLPSAMRRAPGFGS
jgi:hypothetical protein